MLPGNFSIAIALPFAAVILLSGCTAVPRISLPLHLAQADNGEVVSLRAVSQMGSGPVIRTARSQPVPQHWPQPSSVSAFPTATPEQQWNQNPRPAATRLPQQNHQQPTRQIAPPLYIQQQATVNQAAVNRPGIQQEAIRRAMASRQQHAQQAVPLMIHDGRPSGNQQPSPPAIRQVAQQSSPPLVIQWGDHQQSTGRTQTSRTFTASPYPAPSETPAPTSASTQNQAAGTDDCPPNFSLPATDRAGDGCGESTQKKSVDFEQMARLVERVENMEADLKSSRDSITSLTESLATARAEIVQLKKDVGFWQSEVVRLERSMQAQHRSDIASLNRISRVLESLLESDRETPESNPAPQGPPPEFNVAEDPFAPLRN